MAGREENLKKWNPGHAPYSEWLKSLTPEEYQAHLEERRKKKTLKAAMEEIKTQYKAEWAAALHNAAVSVIEKAIRDGDANAFNSVFDRMVGKPEQVVEVNDKFQGYRIELVATETSSDEGEQPLD